MSGSTNVEEQVFLPYPGPRQARSAVHMASQFRSTWLTSSIRALRERKLLDRYAQLLPAVHHEAVLGAVVGVWLPIEVALAHYAACDALELQTTDLIAIGRDATNHVHGTILGTFVRLAKGAGVTPWNVLVRLHDLWNRIWIGGGVSVVKLGPKEARIEIVAWPVANSRYCRVAMRGVVTSLIDLFCERSYAKEVTKFWTPTAVAYQVSWA
jgi:hypothetical protein